MIEEGRVIAIKGMVAVVSITREALSSCAACRNEGGTETVIEVKNNCNASIGDKVNVILENNTFMKSTVVTYGIPFGLFFVGLLLGYPICSLFNIQSIKDLIAFALGLALMVAGYVIIKKSKSSKQLESIYTITKIND